MFTREELNKLLSNKSEINLSIFLSTGAKEQNTEKGKIKLKNLIKISQDKLLERNIEKKEIDRMLEPALNLLEDTNFWIYQSDGLAIFINNMGFYYYKLPIEFKEEAVVSKYFYIRPLFPIFQNNGQFYILALSQNDLKLFHCTKYYTRQVELENVPTSLGEALKYDDAENELHVSIRTGQNTGTNRAGIFHGHGAGKDSDKNNILRYFQEVNSGLEKEILDKEIPIVIASVDYLIPIYQEVNKQFKILSQGISGNPEHITDSELQEKGWEIVEPYFRKIETKIKEQYNALAGTGKASDDLEDILNRAINKGIDKLIITNEEQIWGCFDMESNKLAEDKKKNIDSEELINIAVMHTFLNSGEVYVLEENEMPSKSNYAAIYRY